MFFQLLSPDGDVPDGTTCSKFVWLYKNIVAVFYFKSTSWLSFLSWVFSILGLFIWNILAKGRTMEIFEFRINYMIICK